MDIALQEVVPVPLIDTDYSRSEVWGKNITFNNNQNYLVISPSGAGKTTLLSIMYGIRFDFNGNVRIDNINSRKIKRRNWAQLRTSSISFVFQGLQLFDELTVIENILVKNNLTHYKSKSQIEIFCEQLQISNFLSRKAGKLSFGQKQRVAIIRSLCQPFSFLFLDEPFSHLDVENTKLALDLITQETQQQGAGIILTSVGEQYNGLINNIIRL